MNDLTVQGNQNGSAVLKPALFCILEEVLCLACFEARPMHFGGRSALVCWYSVRHITKIAASP